MCVLMGRWRDKSQDVDSVTWAFPDLLQPNSKRLNCFIQIARTYVINELYKNLKLLYRIDRRIVICEEIKSKTPNYRSQNN